MRHEVAVHGGLSRCGARFVRQVLDLAGPDWVVAWAGERSWASATFEGMRVRATLRLGAPKASRSLSDLCAIFEKADYAAGRYLVADITACEVDRNVRIEALLVEQA